jgi:hypothetical protein
VVSTASPLAAAAQAAMAPVTTSGREGFGLDPVDPGGSWAPASGLPDWGLPGSGVVGASAETLTNPILTTTARRPKQARRGLVPHFMRSRTRAAVSLGVLPTRTPAFSRASFLAWAVPEEPEMIAPACPMVLPSGAVKPAT